MGAKPLPPGLVTGKTARLPPLTTTCTFAELAADHERSLTHGKDTRPIFTPEKRRKYRNVKVTIDGHLFDSKREAARYGELRLLERAGKIRNLIVHPWWQILPTLRIPGLRTMRSRKYTADFSYYDTGGTVEIVEDVKGRDATTDAAYRLRRHLFLSQHPEVDFREIH